MEHLWRQTGKQLLVDTKNKSTFMGGTYLAIRWNKIQNHDCFKFSSIFLEGCLVMGTIRSIIESSLPNCRALVYTTNAMLNKTFCKRRSGEKRCKHVERQFQRICVVVKQTIIVNSFLSTLSLRTESHSGIHQLVSCNCVSFLKCTWIKTITGFFIRCSLPKW